MSKSDDGAPARKGLSVDQAVEMLTGPWGRGGADADGPAEAAEPGDVDEADDACPPFWSDEDRQAFLALPPEVQDRVAVYEKARHVTAARAVQAADQARDHANARAAEAQEMTARLSGLVPQAEAAFAGRWGGREPNWVQVAQVHGPQAALQHKAQFDRQQAAVRQVHALNRHLQAQALAHDRAREVAILRQLRPELAHPQHGLGRRHATMRFLAASGVAPVVLQGLRAHELALAYDAMRYQAAMHVMHRPPRGAVARPSIAPAAAQAKRSTQARKAEASKARFAKRPSIDNAVAAILARG